MNSMNSKNAASNYLKSDIQTMWYRNSQQGTTGGKRKRTPDEDIKVPHTKTETTEPPKKGSDTVVIHPGSRFLRVGFASDPTAETVPHVIARKSKSTVNSQANITVVAPFRETKTRSVVVAAPSNMPEVTDEYFVEADPDDPTDMAVGGIRVNLRARMYHYDKIAVLKDGSDQAAKHNKLLQPVKIPSHEETDHIDWLKPEQESDVLVGAEVYRIADPVKSNYLLRWPMAGGEYNHSDYVSRSEVLGDLETLWTRVLKDSLDIDRKSFKDLSVILIVPDYPDKLCVRDLVHLILVQLGFRRICVQQESTCAAFGASIAHGCVVDIGASKTSVSCVEEGLVLPETRMVLGYGGDDISALYLRLLERIKFPYRDANLARTYDWRMMEDFKIRSASLAEEDVLLLDYDIFVRRPGRSTEKYTVKTYDEPTVSSMLLFDPSVLNFNAKRAARLENPWGSSLVEEMDVLADSVTVAMQHSTALLTLEVEAAAKEAAAKSVSLDPQGDGDMIDGTAPVLKEPVVPVEPPIVNVRLESNKVPLDLAIFHSIQASTHGAGAGGAERLKKMISCCLIVGGAALTPGMLAALDSRLRGLFGANMPGHEEFVAIIPAPKSIDPRELSWKGGSVLARLESVNELWVQQGDWEIFGMRALRERTFFL